MAEANRSERMPHSSNRSAVRGSEPRRERLTVAVIAKVECGNWLDTSPNETAAEPVEKLRKGFWIVVITLVVVNAGGTMPIPLYVLWQPRIRLFCWRSNARDRVSPWHDGKSFVSLP